MPWTNIPDEDFDANSPVTVGLMTDIVENTEYNYVEKIERNGSVNYIATQTWTPGSLTIALLLAGLDLDTEGGDILLGGGNLNTEGGDGTFENLIVNGTMTLPALTTSPVLLTMAGDTETAAAGVLKDSANTLDFLIHLRNTSHFVWVPDVSSNACYFVRDLVDVDNLGLCDTTFQTSNNSVDFGNGNRYMILEGEANDSFILIDSHAGQGTTTIDGGFGGLTRSWIRCIFSFNNPGPTPAGIDVSYGGDTIRLTEGTNNATDEVCMFAVADGVNDLVISWDVFSPSSFSIDIYIDHVQRFSQAGPPVA